MLFYYLTYCTTELTYMAREKRIYIRVSNYEWEQVKQEAEQRGISMSSRTI